MTHFKLDFALDHTSVGDAAVLSGLQAGQRLVLRQQQQEQQRLQATQHGAEPTTVGAAAKPTSAVADGEEQHASSGPQSAASDACTESAGTSEPLANAATAVAAAAAIAPEQPQPPAPPPPAASSVLHVCDGSGQVLGIVPAAAAKRLPPRVDLAAVQVRVRSIKKHPQHGVQEVQLRLEIPPAGSRAAAGLSHAEGQRPGQASFTSEPDPFGFQLSRAQLEQLAASQPVRMALMDERLQQLLTEIDGSANAEKVLEAVMLRDPAFEAFAGQMLEAMQGGQGS